MLEKPGWEQSLRRWRAFWDGEVADRPPIQMAVVSGDALDVGGVPSLERTVARFDPQRNGDVLAAEEAALADRAAIPDDTPPSIQSGGGVYFTGAVFGAPVVATADVMTSEPTLHDWSQLDDLAFSLENPWVCRALSLAEQLVARSGGRYAVTPGLIEGPSDICGALRGITVLGADLYAFTDEVRRLATFGAQAWRQYAEAMHRVVPLYDGGTVTQWGVWAPGRGAALQEDFCTLISPRSYREHFQALDAELAGSVDTAWMHVHAGAIHLVEPLLEVDSLAAIQIVYDGVVSPPLPRLIEAMQSVQEAGKGLIVRKFHADQLAEILPHLDMAGLAIDTYAASLESATAWIESSW